MARGDIITGSHRFYGPCSACGDSDTALEYHKHYGPRAVPSSPSYTLAEIGELAQRYTREFQCSVDDELGTFLELSRFLAWLAKREQGRELRDGAKINS